MEPDNSGVQTYVLKCKSCGGPLNMVEGSSILICPYCGSREVIEESDAVKIEKIRSDAYKTVELGRQRLRREERRAKSRLSVSALLTIVFASILLLFALIGLPMAISEGSVGSAVISVIQIVLLILVLVLVAKKGQNLRRHLAGLMVLAAAILIIPYLVLYPHRLRSAGGSGEELPEWEEVILSSVLPDPGPEIEKIYTDSSERLSFEAYPYTQKQFKSYVKACQEKGFTYEQISSSDSGFEAYNEEGYHLDLLYFDSSREMSVYLDAPIEMSEFLWPSHGLPKLVPAPESNIGRITGDSAQYFTAEIGETGKQDFTAYAGACIDAGFDVEYYLGDTYFSGKNADGVRLSIEYMGFRTMEIRISNYQ